MSMVKFDILDVEKKNENELELLVLLEIEAPFRPRYRMKMTIEKKEGGMWLTYIEGLDRFSGVTKKENKKLSDETIREIQRKYFEKYGVVF